MTSSKCYSVVLLILVFSFFSKTVKAGSFTASGSTLSLDLDVAGQLVTVVSTGTTYTFTLSGGATNTWTGTTSSEVSVSGAVLTVTATGITTFNTINITDSQTGTAVSFGNSGANSYTSDFNITLNNSPAAVNFSGSSSFTGSNALSVSTSMNITFSSLSSLSTVNGNLTLDANTQASPNSMAYAGIYMDSSTVQITGTGLLTVTARGGGSSAVAPQSAGIAVAKGSKLIGGTTGTATILGRSYTGVAGSTSGIGVYVSGGSSSQPARISSNGANVSVTGYGAVSTAVAVANQYNCGVVVGSATQATSSLYGSITAGGSGNVSIVGYGGTAANPSSTLSTHCYGVGVFSSNALITTDGGNLSITGTGGGSDTLSDYNHGIVVNQGAIYPGGTNANLEITGTGGTVSGTGTNGNNGVSLSGAGQIKGGLGTGTALITGYGGGKLNSGYNSGVFLIGGSIISSLGTGAVTVNGTGGGGQGIGSQNYGVYITGGTSPNFSTITSGGGAVTVTGTGAQNTGGTTQNGIQISGAVIKSGGNGNVTVTGTGGKGDVTTTGDGHMGVYLANANSLITSGGTGTVTVNGTGGGDGARSKNIGIQLYFNAGITSGGAGSVTINGTGGNGTGSSNIGLYVNLTSRINSGGGDIYINSTEGPYNTSSYATTVGSNGTISTTANGGNIIIKGNSFIITSGCTIATPASGSITFIPLTDGSPINFTNIGDAKGFLRFNSAELATMSAGTLIFGNSNTATINVSTLIDLSTAPQANLTLINSSSVGGLTCTASPIDIKMAAGKTLNLAGTNSLLTQIVGTNINTQYTQLKVSGTLNLTGLNLEPWGTYTPVAGNVFTIVSATTLTGTFNSLPNGSTVTFNGRNLVINYTDTTVTLTDFSPLITSQPSNQTVIAGSSASFSATATGTPSPTVQWQKSTNGGSTWVDISGATSTTYSFNTAAGDHSNLYQAIFTNTYGSDTTDAVTLTVNSAPVLSSQPSNTTVLAGATASFTAEATGNPSPTLQWQLSTDGGSNWSDISGATSTSYTTGTLTLADNANQYRAVFTNAIGTVNSVAAVLMVNAASLSWNGSVSTDWNNPTNWTPNGIPASGASITIPVGLTNYPVLDQSRSTNSLTIANGINLSVGSSSLTVTGDLTNNGTISGIGSIILSGTNAQTISGTGTISNLSINNANGVSISNGSNRQTITGTLTPTAGTLTTNGNLTLKSDANGTARIAEGSGNYISGNVEVERYIGTNQRAWRLLSIPMTGATIREAWAGTAANSNANGTNESTGSGTLITGHGYTTGTAASAAGFDWFNGLNSSSTSSIRYYNNNNWNSATNTPDITAAPDKQGYMLYIRGDRTVASNAGSGTTTLRPSGALKINTQTISISNNYEVVGNPYASPIDLDAMYNNTGNSAVIERNFWIWDATLGSNGGFRALSSSGGSSYIMTGGSGSASDYLKVQSGQAFFVKKAANGNITIEENNKIGGSSPIVLGVATPITGTVGLVRVELNSAINQLDGVALRFNDGYQSAPTETYDMAKLNNFNENLSLVNGSSYLSIDSRPYPTAKDTVRLAFWNLAPNTYTLQLSSSNLNGRIGTAMLVDNFTNTTQPINLTGDTTRYSFAVTSNSASSSLNRFTVIFGQQASLPVNFLQISASTKGTGISVRWNTAQESELSRFEVERSADGVSYSKIGTVQPNNTTIGGSYEWLDIAAQKGHNFYRIKSVNQNANFYYSPVVKADWSRLATVELLPTITTDGLVTLVMREQPLGKYQVQMRAVNGALVYKKTVDHSNLTGMYELKLGEGGVQLVQGIYWLELSNGKGVRQQFKVVKN